MFKKFKSTKTVSVIVSGWEIEFTIPIYFIILKESPNQIEYVSFNGLIKTSEIVSNEIKEIENLHLTKIPYRIDNVLDDIVKELNTNESLKDELLEESRINI